MDSEIRTDEIVNELLAALLVRLKAEPPEHWRSRFLGKKPTDDDVRRLFREEVQSEIDRLKTDFSPNVFTAYKDVTYQTFKDPRFRGLMENRLGKKDIDRIFSEYDAAPERQQRRDDPKLGNGSTGKEPVFSRGSESQESGQAVGERSGSEVSSDFEAVQR
jgi:hypothetical protein